MKDDERRAAALGSKPGGRVVSPFAHLDVAATPARLPGYEIFFAGNAKL